MILKLCWSFLFLSLLLCLACTKYRDVPFSNVVITPPDSLGFHSLVINEFTPKGKVDTNEFGMLGKWFELYNPGSKDIRLDSSFYFSDTLPWPDKYHFKEPVVPQIVPSKGFLVIWTDNCDTLLGNKVVHTNFSLSSSGGHIIISKRKPDGNFMYIDSVTYGDYNNAVKGISIGHYPDGTSGFKQLSARTPGNPNQL